ncbi:MAG: hypothetical protein IE909_06890, partial [Campylobacterales bacterium]|nr:hypothetical protein [Campylobacterales bacterium]
MKELSRNIFLEDIQNKCSQIVYMSVVHMIDKKFPNVEILDKDLIDDFFANYKNYHLYLNDYAGVIYNRFASSINEIYITVCELLKIDIDNKYTLEHVILKLEKQTPQLLLGLTDSDIQKQTIEHFDEKLEAIEQST